jgi:hypothetical protein
LSKYGNFCKKIPPKNALVQVSLGFLLSPWCENLEKKRKRKRKKYDMMPPNGFFNAKFHQNVKEKKKKKKKVIFCYNILKTIAKI